MTLPIICPKCGQTLIPLGKYTLLCPNPEKHYGCTVGGEIKEEKKKEEPNDLPAEG